MAQAVQALQIFLIKIWVVIRIRLRAEAGRVRNAWEVGWRTACQKEDERRAQNYEATPFRGNEAFRDCAREGHTSPSRLDYFNAVLVVRGPSSLQALPRSALPPLQIDRIPLRFMSSHHQVSTIQFMIVRSSAEICGYRNLGRCGPKGLKITWPKHN